MVQLLMLEDWSLEVHRYDLILQTSPHRRFLFTHESDILYHALRYFVFLVFFEVRYELGQVVTGSRNLIESNSYFNFDTLSRNSSSVSHSYKDSFSSAITSPVSVTAK